MQSDHLRRLQAIAVSQIATSARSNPTAVAAEHEHAFDLRNIHPEISSACKKLFDDGHFQEAAFKAFKVIEIRVRKESGSKGVGHSLMMSVFDEANPRIRLTALGTESEVDEQRGFRFLFAGAFPAVRNPRGHDEVRDTLDDCLDHLSLASYLLRRLDRKHS